MLGPLKFGIQKTPLAAAPSRFALTLSLEGGILDTLILGGPTGATAFIDWGNGTSSTIGLTGGGKRIGNHSCGSTATISGSNLINELSIIQYYSNKIKSITGTYPTSIDSLNLRFNYADPVFTPPNVSTLYFYGSPGPSNLTTGSNLTSLSALPPNLTRLDLTASTKLTRLPDLPAGLTGLSPPPSITVFTGLPSTITTLIFPPTSTSVNVSGCTGLTSLTVPSKVTTLNISKCTGITTVTLPAALTTLRIDGSGLTSLDLVGTNVTTLNIPPSMYSQLRTLNVAGSKLKLAGLLDYSIPQGSNWSLY